MTSLEVLVIQITLSQSLEIILDATMFANGRASRFGQSLGFVVLEAADLVLTQCPNATTGGIEGALFSQLIAQHSPLQSQ